MKKIGFISYSTPFKWITDTNMAHNKIWSWLVMELSAHGGYEMTVLADINSQTASAMGAYGCRQGKLSDQSFLVVFCGPFSPIVQGSLILQALKTIRDFQGVVLYVTCDYLLHFNPSVKRYGKALSDWPDDSFSKGKSWRYVLHSTLGHHFKTPASLETFKAFPNMEYYLVLPDLTMAGIDPKWETRTAPLVLRHKTMYCGAFRPNREDFFRRYFCHPDSAGFVVSTSSPDKFRKLNGFSSTVCLPMSGRIWDAISTSWAQVIGGDTFRSPDADTPLPTRFWEAVSARVPVFFDQVTCGDWKCLYSMGIPPRFVSSAISLRTAVDRLQHNQKLRSFIIEEQLELIKGLSLYDRWNVKEWFA